ncbi:glutathione S-transferase Mu 1 isoform X2 [Folsomia candida]|uniref:glutathione transferase n=1 Tax=Folsomia candida TaxID=158441 RepID=A0A226DWP0_FOLCA|nr:glutathione S-transferase Mu 1 isoform X2 [Folsomia candida]OXA49673.1 Glutathione S-transferase Mu 1 [Folsomia candida]
MSNSKPVFGYHGLRGIAQPIRFQLAYLGVDYVDKQYPLTQEGAEEWAQEKEHHGLDFPNLPYWKDGEVNMTESRAILKFLARTEGGGKLIPTDARSLVNAEMVEGLLWDVWYGLIWRCYLDSEDMINALARCPPKLEVLNKFLGNKKWVLGDQISYVDFMLYEILHQYSLYDPKYLSPCGALLKLKANFEELPAIKKYMASPEYIAAPCFHPMYAKHKVVGLTC